MTYRSDAADQIKQLLTMREVAERYGFTPDRSGFLRCPFHAGDNHGSLKVYDGNRGFHCFGCGAGGSVIDFVMKLFDTDFKGAVQRINDDFNLGLQPDKPVIHAQRSMILARRRAEERKKATAEAEYRRRSAEYRQLIEICKTCAPEKPGDEIDPLYADALHRLPILENWLDENLGR